jgi:sugar/nucleoside kinase (ribokinase family)|tara:strand:+ start:20484 stop:21296 length:813 start_codon:yes stop_codon:yes gene_type:complete
MFKSLVIGNPSIDILNGKVYQPGGPVAYVANTLSLIGLEKIKIISSFDKEYSINHFDSKITTNIDNSNTTTKFNTYYKNSVRYQILESKASILNLNQISNKKLLSDIVFFTPVMDEIKISDTNKIVNNNEDTFFVSLPQGWIRKNNQKNITYDFSNMKLLPTFDIIFFSEEEIYLSKIAKNELLDLAKVLVITNGKNGSTIYYKNNTFKIDAHIANTIDTLGAGDIYAAVFSATYFETKNLIIAGEKASKIASKSTAYRGLKSVNSNILI